MNGLRACLVDLKEREARAAENDKVSEAEPEVVRAELREQGAHPGEIRFLAMMAGLGRERREVGPPEPDPEIAEIARRIGELERTAV